MPVGLSVDLEMSVRGLVLVVEDEPIIRMLATEMVEEAGFDVIEAGEASEALRILSSQTNIGCVFSDINMPGALDGLQLASIIHKEWPSVHVILTSGRMQRDKDIEVSDRFVQKPYTFDEVSQALEICIGGQSDDRARHLLSDEARRA